MTFRQLMAFAAVARHLNITRAAKELRTSQPGLSKQLKTLQDHYDVRLFTRTGKRIELTEDGRELLNYIDPILIQLEKIEARFSRDYKKTTPAELILGGTYEVSATILPSLIAVFKKEFPNVYVTLRSNTVTILERMLLNGEIEIALSSIAPRSPELSVETCVPLNLVAFAAKKYPIAARTLTPADLETVPLIVRDNRDARGASETFLLNLRKQGYRPNIAMRCETPEAVKAAVSEQLGIGILYDRLLSDDLARGRFRQLQIEGISVAGTTYIVLQQHRPISACGSAFLKLLRHFCELKRREAAKLAGNGPFTGEFKGS